MFAITLYPMLFLAAMAINKAVSKESKFSAVWKDIKNRFDFVEDLEKDAKESLLKEGLTVLGIYLVLIAAVKTFKKGGK